VTTLSETEGPMQIREWMKFPVRTAKPRDTVAHTRATLEELRINQLPVVMNEHLVGIVTDRDLRDAPRAVVVSAAAAGKEIAPDADEIRIEDVMTAAVITLSPSDTLQQAAELMRRERVGALPIVEKGHLAGILTRSDILEAFLALSGREDMKGEHHEAASKPTRRQRAHKEPQSGLRQG
jgi:acetoin utilization protein AcuB